MTTTRKIQLAWKYRKPLWRYRNVIRHRKEIAAWAAVSVAVAAGILLTRRRTEQLSA